MRKYPRATMLLGTGALASHIHSIWTGRHSEILGIMMPDWWHYLGAAGAICGIFMGAWFWLERPKVGPDAYTRKDPWGEK